jgi:transposase-like protein
MPAGSEVRRRFTDEEKADAVRQADESGSDSAVAREIGCHATSIGNWRKAGLGRRPKSTTEVPDKAKAKSKETAAGPTVRCPICKTGAPIEGEISEVTKAQALREHYKTKPECREALRARRA